MLPWELAVYRVRKGKVIPVFQDLSEHNWSVARSVIDTFKGHVGKTRKELDDDLNELTITPDYKFVKGLIRIMERKCVYEEGGEAIDFRRIVFKKYPEDPVLRARELGISMEDMLSKMFSDINPRLLNVRNVSPAELLKEYNLSLAQTMLFKSVNIETYFSNERVYSALKYLGLIYVFESKNRVLVDGPSSIFTSTTRYGTRFARLLPFIVEKAPWNVKAVLKLRGDMPILELDHLRHGYYFSARGEELDEDIDITLPAECRMEMIYKPLKIGDMYFLPNFRILCGNRVAYVEVFKFWSWKYVDERARIISDENFPMFFFLKKDGNVAKEAPERGKNVFLFSSKIGKDMISRAMTLIPKMRKKEEDNKRIEHVKEKLMGVKSYEEAEKIIKEVNLPVIETLQRLGYRIIWRGLMPYGIKKVDKKKIKFE